LRSYQQRFPNRRHPCARTIANLGTNLRIFGCFYPNQGTCVQPQPVRDANINVLRLIEENVHTSTRAIAAELSISQSTVVTILREMQFHPYKLQLHQALREEHYALRVDFFQWAVEQGLRFFENVLFTDECSFRNTGHVNLHNAHYWAVENPSWMQTVNHQGRWSVNVWCGVLGDRVIGPHFFDGKIGFCLQYMIGGFTVQCLDGKKIRRQCEPISKLSDFLKPLTPPPALSTLA